MHANTRFVVICIEQLQVKFKTKVVAGLGQSILGKTVPSGLEWQADGHAQDLEHSSSQYGPSGQQIT